MSTHQGEINSRYDDPGAYSGKHPPDWEARRKTVYRRDDWTCQQCERKSGPHAGDEGVRLHAHHIQALSEGGSNRLSNLVTLCEPCHQNSHTHDIFTGGWVGDGPRVYTTGSVRATARGVLAAGTVSVWVVLFIRWLLREAGYAASSVEVEAVGIGVTTLTVMLILLPKPVVVTAVLGIGAAGFMGLGWINVGWSLELAVLGLIVWPPVLIGVWAIVRGHLRP